MVGDPPRGEERQKVGVSVQQQSTATTELFSTFAFIQMRPDQRKQGSKRLLRGVRDEEVAGSNPVTPTVERLVRCLFRILDENWPQKPPQERNTPPTPIPRPNCQALLRRRAR